MSAELTFPGDGFDAFLHFLYIVPSQPKLINGSIGYPQLSVLSNQAKDVSFGSTVAIVSEKSKEWAENYKALKAYHAKHGNCSVPFGKDTVGLRSWVERQKMLYKEVELEQSKIDDLKQLNFDFDTETKVSARILNYAPPRGLPEKSSLRNNSKHSDQGKGSEENAGYDAWFKNYEALKSCHDGLCILDGEEAGYLSSWLERQKKLHKDGQLESGKVDLLRALDVDLDGAPPPIQPAKESKLSGLFLNWSVKKSGVKEHTGVVEDPKTWDHNYKVLKMYKEKHGTVEIKPFESEKTDALLAWLEKQKKAHSGGNLNYSRNEKLRDLGIQL